MNFQQFDLFSLFREFKKVTQDQQNSAEEIQQELIQKAIQNLRSQQAEEYQKIEIESFSQDINIPLRKNNQIDIRQNKLTDQEEMSDTISISLISDKLQQLNIQDCLLWFEDFKQYGLLFQPRQKYTNFIKTKKFDSILNNDIRNDIYKRNNTILYSGFNTIEKDWIVIKEQIVPQDCLLNTSQQFIIHNQIYQLYPNYFVQLVLPVYIEEQIESNQFTFISQLEYGEINLYDYSQQNIIKDTEYQLIFQQIYQQINLLHKHNVAHRDIKPQNIVYVENKGWLLCDFGDTIKYETVNGIYNIRGTYAFLQTYLQQLSHIQGISLKQNLYENDIYALAITLLVIKYQIKNQNEILEYLNKQEDQIINSLIKNPNKNLDNLFIQTDQPFIKPQLVCIDSSLNIKEIRLDEIQGFVEVLRHFKNFNEQNEELKSKIIKIIDEALEQKNKHFNYISLFCYSRISRYVKEFRYIIKFEKIRSSKYWKQLLEQQILQQNRNHKIAYIRLMYNLGLSDLTLHYARQFLKNDYDFLVHIIITIILFRLRQYDMVQQEYNLILAYKDFKQIDSIEYDYFAYLTLQIVSWDHLSNDDVKFIEKTANIQYYDYDPSLFTEQQYCNQEFRELLVKTLTQNFDISQNKQDLMLIAFKYIQFFQINININATLNFISLIKQHIKYTCTTYHWQKLITEQVQIQILLIKNYQIKKNIKEINYVLIFNSESKMQYYLLKIIKLLNLYKLGIKKLHKYQKINKQIKDIIFNMDQISFNFYKKIILKEFLNFNYFMIKEAQLEAKLGSYYKYQFQILTYIGNNENLIYHFQEGEKLVLIQLIERIFIQTLNFRRYSQLYNFGYAEKKKQIKYSLINYSQQNDIKTVLSLKMFKTLEKHFQLIQYINRI